MEWIACSVKDAPVGQDRLLLVDGDPSYMCVGYFNRIARAWCVNGEILKDVLLPVTHWQPLPEPPK